MSKWFGMTKQQFKLLIANGLIMLTTFLLISFAKANQTFIEYVYSRKVYLFLANTLAFIEKNVGFAIGEIIAATVIIGAIIAVAFLIYYLCTKNFVKSLTVFLSLMTCVTGAILYFNLMWGLNNYRQDVETLFELGTKDEITIEVLSDVYIELVTRANEIRDSIQMEDYSKDFIFQTTDNGYQALHATYPFIDNHAVRVKPLLISPWFSSSGYTGVYLFFSGEPSINNMAPIYGIPFFASHEVAHQKGFASEDEANFIGFMAAISQDDPLFQYSAYYTAIKYVGNAIRKNDEVLYQSLAKQRSEAVMSDLYLENDFWDNVIIEKNREIHNKINDQFLKSTNQPDGVLNYSKVTELLALAYLEDLF
jgi:hypothetical protein